MAERNNPLDWQSASMVPPVNLNIPGFPYLFFAVVFVAIVLFGALVLSPLELAVRRHNRSRTKGRRSVDNAAVTGTDLLFGAARTVTRSEDRTVRECRRCGTTLDSEQEECPRCGAPPSSIARYELG